MHIQYINRPSGNIENRQFRPVHLILDILSTAGAQTATLLSLFLGQFTFWGL